MTTGIPEIISYSRINVFEGKSIFVNEKDSLENFDVKRIYWINYSTAEPSFSAHAHKTLQQVIIPISGKISISLENKDGKVYDYTLNDPAQGLYIPAMHWKRIQYSGPCSLLCLASGVYDENDYIREYDSFKATL